MAQCRQQTKCKQNTALFTACSDGDGEQLLNHKEHAIQKASEKAKAKELAKIGLITFAKTIFSLQGTCML